MDLLVKDFYLKRKWRKDDLIDKLDQIEQELQNKKVTSTEEKKYMVEIEKIRQTLGRVEEYEELHNEYTIVKNDLKGIVVQDLSSELREKFRKLKEYQEEYRSLKNIKNQEQKIDGEKREVSAQEIKL